MKRMMILGVLLLALQYAYAPAYGQLEIGADAPGFTLTDTEGEPYSLSNYEGKAVLLIFLGANCPYCKESAPYVESLIWKKYRDANFQILGIDQWDYSAAQLKTLFENPTGVTFPLLQKGSGVALDYKVTYDWFILLNAEHKVAYVATGTLPTHGTGGTAEEIVQELEKEVEKVVGDGVTSVDDEIPDVLPVRFQLGNNYPNPFNPSTTIMFSLSRTAGVRLTVYDIRGAVLKTLIHGESRPGSFLTTWDGRNDRGIPAASGIYFYRLEIWEGNSLIFADTKKMLLAK